MTQKPTRGVVYELLYADDLVLMHKTMENLKDRFFNWKSALESKGLKVNTTKKVMVNWLEGDLLKSKINPCGVCGRKLEIGFI